MAKKGKAARLLSRQQILDVDDLTTETVEVPEWGGAVVVRTLTAWERDAFDESMFQLHVGKSGVAVEKKIGNIRARLVSMCCVNGDGGRLFTDEDVERLGQKSGAAMDRVFAVAQRMNRLLGADIEELAKN